MHGDMNAAIFARLLQPFGKTHVKAITQSPVKGRKKVSMALIGKIRSHGWIMIVLIGLAMAGFIFMDMFSSDVSILSGRSLSVGEVEGTSIDQPDYERAFSALYSGGTGDQYRQRQEIWNWMVEDQLVRSEAREIGLMVPQEELEDLLYGNNLSPLIQQRFRDQNTGQVNREVINSYRDAVADGTIHDPNTVDPARKNFWFFQQREVNKQRLQDKLGHMLANAMYTPDWKATELAKGANTRVDFAYVKIPYDKLEGNSVTLEDADFAAYMASEGPKLKRKTEGRTLAYVVFDVKPTAADSAAIRQDLEERKQRWAEAEKDSAFVIQNRGTFPVAYFEEANLPEAVKGAEPGTIVGPYEDQGSYAISKVIARKSIPDSVRSRHILLRASTQEEAMRASLLADSLKNLIDSGAASFADLASQFSSDAANASSGGDLGFAAQGMMVQPFNDMIFFQGEPGEVNKVVTQFGLHLVEVTDRKFGSNKTGTRLATISKPIIPSDATQKARYDEASRFAQTNRSVEELRKAAEANAELSFVEGIIVGPNDFEVGQLGSGVSSRDIVKYAFKPTDGEVSPNVYRDNAPGAFHDGQYVIAAVTGELKPGIPDWKAIRSIIEPEVKKRKQAALLASNSSDLQTLAQRFGLEPDTARAVTYNTPFVPGVGSDPQVLAAALSLAPQSSSAPIAASDGIFVIKPILRTEPEDISATTANVRRNQDAQISNSVLTSLGYALRESADVVDKRSRFY